MRTVAPLADPTRPTQPPEPRLLAPVETRFDWLDARPFRAHVRHLMAAGGLSVETVAALAGVPVRATRSLAEGRHGRPVRRVNPEIGRRLVRVTVLDARRVHTTLVAITPTRARLAQLARGRSTDELAARLGLPSTRVAHLLGDADACTHADALRVLASHRAAMASDEQLSSRAT